MKMKVRQYMGLYEAFWRNSVIREMGFKANFLLWIVVETLWFALQLCFITVIYRHTERIGDWTQWQVVLLIGTSQLIQQLFQSIFLSNVTQLSELIRTGKLDFMLLLPVNTRFVVSLRQVDLGGFFNAGTALAIVAYSLHQLGVMPTGLQVSGYVFLVAAGVLIHYAMMFLLGCVSFWTVQAGGVVWGYYSLFTIARLPDEVFRGFARVLFTFAIPMLLVANVPARWIMGELQTPWRLGLVVAVTVVALGLSEAAWRFSIRRYTSASS